MQEDGAENGDGSVQEEEPDEDEVPKVRIVRSFLLYTSPSTSILSRYGHGILLTSRETNSSPARRLPRRLSSSPRKAIRWVMRCAILS